MRYSVVGAIIFLGLGLISGYISDYMVSSMGWEAGLLTSLVGFGVFFILLVWLGRAQFGLAYLLMFCLLGFVSSWIAGFLGDMWGITGSLYGSALTVAVLFVLILLLGQKRTSVETT